MNEIVKQLSERKSVRVFEQRKITQEEKNTILEAAVMAPTAGNQQLYTILDITDQSLKEELVKTCDNQPFIAKADMVLIFCADCRKWYDAFVHAGCKPRTPGVGDLMLAVTDTAIAAQNAVTAAWSLGIGSCYIGDVMENCEKQRRLLKLPYMKTDTVIWMGTSFGRCLHQKQGRNRTKNGCRHFALGSFSLLFHRR